MWGIFPLVVDKVRYEGYDAYGFHFAIWKHEKDPVG